ncbi:uncharacterized protein LOC116105567 isoform X3 [Pistacia vera]|uniref:uncharacterized protein LOC116105567 isoform X3 n=1 Tax=Pistacia vera TaxID=55513 RepID=UPI001263AB79|nr:uncharacterized protein LOC116105567 isoform X3 [Pistacia vera]
MAVVCFVITLQLRLVSLLSIHLWVFEFADSNRLESDLEELNCSLDLVASPLGQGKAIEDPHADCYKDGEDQSDMVKIHEDQKFEEEIKITSLTVFINLYSEPDEEEGEKAKEEENAEDEDKVRFWTLLNISCL